MTNEESPLIEFEESGPVTLGRVVGTTMLDGSTVNQFGEEAVCYVQGRPGLRILFDFGNVEYMSSAGLTELLRVHHALRPTDGEVRLCGLSNEIRKVFKITNLDKLFVIHEGEDAGAALRRFERSVQVGADEESWARADGSG